MKSHHPENFVKEVLADDGLAEFRETSLQYGLATIRRRRKHVFLGRTMVLGLPLFVALAIVVSHISSPSGSNSPQLSNQVKQQSREPLAPTKVISDEELFALFPNRPMALIGKPGHQEVVFLDQPRTQTTQLR